MAKNKLSTPAWVLEGYDSPEEYEKARGKTTKTKKEKAFKIRKCPECGSFDVVVVIEKETIGLWKCKKCGWEGKNIGEEELTEEEFMKYMDEIAPNQVGPGEGVPSIEGDINIEGREEVV